MRGWRELGSHGGRVLVKMPAVSLTDVDGVRDAAGVSLGDVTASDAARLRDDGTLHGWMTPKVEAALDALAAHPGAGVKIVPGGPDALRSALRDDVGTRFVQEPVGVEHG